jgi:prefoldin subunit 5
MGEETPVETPKVVEVTLRKVENGFIVVVGQGKNIHIASDFDEACEIVKSILE